MSLTTSLSAGLDKSGSGSLEFANVETRRVHVCEYLCDVFAVAVVPASASPLSGFVVLSSFAFVSASTVMRPLRELVSLVPPARGPSMAFGGVWYWRGIGIQQSVAICHY